METQTYKASISRDDSKVTLLFVLGDTMLNIPLTEDKPNEVKTAFNKMLIALKKEKFKFELDDTKEDLYHHIGKEYLTQLNSELEGAYKELADYGLLDTITSVDVEIK